MFSEDLKTRCYILAESSLNLQEMCPKNPQNSCLFIEYCKLISATNQSTCTMNMKNLLFGFDFAQETVIQTNK